MLIVINVKYLYFWCVKMDVADMRGGRGDRKNRTDIKTKES